MHRTFLAIDGLIGAELDAEGLHVRTREHRAYAWSPPETLREQFSRDAVGSFVAFDPTGRNLPDCLTVGRVEAVRFESADDGDAEGTPRPILSVRENRGGDLVAVTTIAAVLASGDPANVAERDACTDEDRRAQAVDVLLRRGDPMQEAPPIEAMTCRECGRKDEPHASGLCDSCETAEAYDRASFPVVPAPASLVRTFEIVHSFSGEVVGTFEATCPADALAAYSLADGFADPRETAATLTERVPPHGSTEGDYFYLRDDGFLGMTYTNYALHAEPAEAISSDPVDLSYLDEAAALGVDVERERHDPFFVRAMLAEIAALPEEHG